MTITFSRPSLFVLFMAATIKALWSAFHGASFDAICSTLFAYAVMWAIEQPISKPEG